MNTIWVEEKKLLFAGAAYRVINHFATVLTAINLNTRPLPLIFLQNLYEEVKLATLPSRLLYFELQEFL